MSKSGEDYLSCHLRAAGLAPDLSVKLKYSFTVIHPSQQENKHFSLNGPLNGRTFSRNQNTLSWGWKQFFPRRFLAYSSPDDEIDFNPDQCKGDFMIDGHKILLQVEIKEVITKSEQVVSIPEISAEYAHPSVQTRPISYAGFAWQIRAFPNGYDEVSKGRLILQLFCTTSSHLAKCKLQFIVNDKISSPVFSHTFPANSISSLPNIIVLPTATKHIISSEITVGIDFKSLTEVNEVQITLANPQTYPAVTMSSFTDMEKCQWVLKSLQSLDMKVKLDIDSNYRENIPSSQHYTRHLLWNLWIIPVALDIELQRESDEDISQKRHELVRNLNNNTDFTQPKIFKRYQELIGYFTPDYSDAEEAKTGFCPIELLCEQNPYRVTLSDGNEDEQQWTVITLHVEIISNLLLYKTPAPSPVADLERLSMHELKREFLLLTTQYNSLTVDMKNKLTYPSENTKTESVRRSEREPATSEIGTQVSLTKIQPSTHIQIIKRSETKLSDDIKPSLNWEPVVDASLADDFTKLITINDLFDIAKPPILQVKYLDQQVKEFTTWLHPFLEEKTGIHITRIVSGGKTGCDLLHKHVFDDRKKFPGDLQLYCYSPDLPRAGFKTWQPSLVRSIAVILEQKFNNEVSAGGLKLMQMSKISYTDNSVRLFLECPKFETVSTILRVEIFLAYEWCFGASKSESGTEVKPGLDPLTSQIVTRKGSTSEPTGISSVNNYRPAVGDKQIQFIKSLSMTALDFARFLCMWRDQFSWEVSENNCNRPSTYALILLATRAYEQANLNKNIRNVTVRDILKEFCDVITSDRHKKKAIVWSSFYQPTNRAIKLVIARHRSKNDGPIIVDPANPTFNVRKISEKFW